MKRRAFLASGTVVALAGCLGESGSDGARTEAWEPSTFVNDFETTTTDGVEVPLAPIETTYEWQQNDEVRFVDARGQTS